MGGEHFDGGDNGGPTSHRYFYDMEREQLFTLFVGAIKELRVDDDGCHCLSAEAQAISRMARAVQARADSDIAREDELAGMATVTRVLLSRTDGRDKGEDQSWYEPLADLVAHFVQLRSELGDFLPPTQAGEVPDALTPAMIESLRDGPNPDGPPGVRTDEDGRPWIEPDPGDEMLPYDHPDVQAMAERDPALAEMIAEDEANPWPWP
jgi:hypothetical protein